MVQAIYSLPQFICRKKLGKVFQENFLVSLYRRKLASIEVRNRLGIKKQRK